MTVYLWLKGVLYHRAGHLLGSIAGVALTVALLISLGAFIAASAASMSARARQDVAVDWQVLLSAGADQGRVSQALNDSGATVAQALVEYADVAGFSANTGGTVQTTGPGKALALSAAYRQEFPSELRLLTGSLAGVLAAQQTAANLHVGVGETVTIQRVGMDPTNVTVAGIVELPYADSLFQAIGAPPGSSPQAPPDNVLLLPSEQWHTVFDPQAATRPDSVQRQIHVRLGATLPSDPGAAYTAVEQVAHNFEAKIVGSAVVGNNLAARLDAVRADALYARVLFLFLGAPGTLLAILLTLAVAASGSTRRAQEQALLQARGASRSQVLRLQSVEALVVALGGVVLGIMLAAFVTWQLLSISALFNNLTRMWTIGAALIGFMLALVAILLPAWRQIQQSTIVSARRAVGRSESPLWQKFYPDLILLAAALLFYWRSTDTGYQVVLAPEGVPTASVSYEAFLGPMALWLGGALLAWRLWSGGLAKGRKQLSALFGPWMGGIAELVAAAVSRQHLLLTRGIVLVALAFAFAVSTAVFNTTYHAQALVDASLTNGADVTVTGLTALPPSSKLDELAALPGVVAAQAMQHRLAYVGNDLQDLFGIDAAHIGDATTMADAYFANGNAKATLAKLAATPDGVLVAQETVTDFQLQPGDLINLRLQNESDHQYHSVPFHLIGVVREFPTAPRDSFLVANAGYVTQQTGSSAAETVLLHVSGDPAVVAQKARAVVNALPAVHVQEIGETQSVIGSSLTSINLHGLTQLELAFALVLVSAASGLIMALSLLERRRSLAILSALGARGPQLAAFVWSEGIVLLVGGALTGSLVGITVAQMLVKILKDVFDPPPEVLAMPWGYLAALGVVALLSTAIGSAFVQWISRRLVVEKLREL